MKNKIIYYKKLLKLIESLKEKEIYPKKYSNEKLKHELSNLYVVEFLISNSYVYKEDKNTLITTISPTIITHIVQSLFYDVIGHYDQEIEDFYEAYQKFDTAQKYFYNKLADLSNIYTDLLKKNKLSSEDKKILSKIINNLPIIYKNEIVDEILKTVNLLTEILYKNFNPNTFQIGDSLKHSIQDWINKMKQIPQSIWKAFAYYNSDRGSIMNYKSITVIFDEYYNDITDLVKKDPFTFKPLEKTYIDLEDIIETLWDEEKVIFFHMDKPYYDAFYNNLLPLYNEFQSYLIDPKKDSFEKLIYLIDHIKDLQHHSNFFWTSLKKDTMDFISHTSINKLIQYVTDPDIKKIYKKYYILFNK